MLDKTTHDPRSLNTYLVLHSGIPSYYENALPIQSHNVHLIYKSNVEMSGL